MPPGIPSPHLRSGPPDLYEAWLDGFFQDWGEETIWDHAQRLAWGRGLPRRVVGMKLKGFLFFGGKSKVCGSPRESVIPPSEEGGGS